MERHQYVLLALITVAGAILRFRHLGAWSFWIDEIFTLVRVDAHMNLSTILRTWWHPSLSNMLTGVALDTLGVSEWSARLVPALVGTATIPVLYLPVRKLFGVHAALLAALLLSLSTWHLEWSQNARFYSMLLLLYMLASFAFYQAVETGRRRYVGAFYILMLFAMGERFMAACLVPVGVTYLLLLRFMPFEKPAGLRPRCLVPLVAPLGCIVGLDVLRFFFQGESFFLHWASLTYDSPVDDPLRLAASFATSLGVPLLVFAIVSGIGLVLRKSRAGLFVFLGALIPIGVLLLLNPFTFTRDRYVFMSLPNWLILAGAGLWLLVHQARGTGRLLAAGVVVLLAADAAAGTITYFRVNNGHRLDWRGAFAQIGALRSEGDRVVTFWPELGRYYLRSGDDVIAWSDVTPAAVRATPQRHWFVLDSETVLGNRPMKQWVEQHATLLDVRYLRRPARAHLKIYVYDPLRE